MKNRYIPACVTLMAGLACCIMSIVNRWSILYSLIVLLFVLMIFYCLGSVAGYVIREVQRKNEEQRLEEERRLLEEKRLEEEERVEEERRLKEEHRLQRERQAQEVFEREHEL